MSKVKSGLILIAVGIGVNVIGMNVLVLLMTQHWVLTPPSPIFLGFFVLFMVASLMVVLFGVFRLIVGLLGRKKPAETPRVTLPNEGVWPPAPKPPDAS